jgi:hypothetical protein
MMSVAPALRRRLQELVRRVGDSDGDNLFHQLIEGPVKLPHPVAAVFTYQANEHLSVHVLAGSAALYRDYVGIGEARK